MNKHDLVAHNWPDNLEQARKIQAQLRHQVIRENDLDVVNFVAGVDVGFEDNGITTRAAVAVLNFPELTLHEKIVSRSPTCFPYIPGYLSFRELPGVMDALLQLNTKPDLILCDGQGIAHPRRFGIACHLGVLTNIPTIGVAKSRLVGAYSEPGTNKSEWSNLIDTSPSGNNEVIGAVLRTRSNVKPLIISIGHRVDLETAIDYTLKCTTRYRLPETTRWAHKLASG